MRSRDIRWAVGLSLGSAVVALATPLRMDYCRTPIGGGQFEYEFTLILDNNDGTWSAGQAFGWIIFGDAPAPGPSPMADFVVDPGSLPVGPWTQVDFSGGGHNGPNLGPVAGPTAPLLWTPASVGESLTWKGTSAANLPQGQMLWSNLFGFFGAPVAEFIVAAEITCPGQCYPDCNTSGTLTVSDFICFQGAFVGGNMYADCNSTGTLTIADFICFQAEFVAGCP